MFSTLHLAFTCYIQHLKLACQLQFSNLLTGRSVTSRTRGISECVIQRHSSPGFSLILLELLLSPPSWLLPACMHLCEKGNSQKEGSQTMTQKTSCCQRYPGIWSKKLVLKQLRFRFNSYSQLQLHMTQVLAKSFLMSLPSSTWQDSLENNIDNIDQKNQKDVESYRYLVS